MSFVDFWKEHKGDNEYSERAIGLLVNSKLSDKSAEESKFTDFDSSDMESKSPSKFIPSLFYTFIYESDNDNYCGIKFVDAMPLILCMKKDKKWVYGLNFNLMKSELRAVVLDIINKAYSYFYTEKGLDAAINGNFLINEDFSKLLVDDKQRMDFLNVLQSNLGIPIKSTYRKYNISHIKNPRMIEYGEYKYIPLLNFKDSVRGASLSKIQDAATI